MSEPDISYHSNGNIASIQYIVYNDPNDFSCSLHRLDGPAQTLWHPNGNIYAISYRVNDLPHRLDGPADIAYFDDGSICDIQYYINGERIFCSSDQEFKKIVKLMPFK